jgi:hypothetical protein
MLHPWCWVVIYLSSTTASSRITHFREPTRALAGPQCQHGDPPCYATNSSYEHICARLSLFIFFLSLCSRPNEDYLKHTVSLVHSEHEWHLFGSVQAHKFPSFKENSSRQRLKPQMRVRQTTRTRSSRSCTNCKYRSPSGVASMNYVASGMVTPLLI